MDKDKYWCLFCNARLSTEGYLKKHENSIHKNIKFDCKDCGKQFKLKRILATHVNSVHQGIKYKCDQSVWEYLRMNEFIHMWSEFFLIWYDFIPIWNEFIHECVNFFGN